MSAHPVRPPFVRWLYNHNPFYVISAALMLFAVRSAYGELEIGAINCWLMLGVLAAYTSLLAGIGVLIVRKGKVWEDARSILVLLMILFLAVSISADDLFVNMESATGGAALLLCGYIFSAFVMEAVLAGTRIRLGAVYRAPYHLIFALFYAAPWWCSPALHPRSTGALEWMIFLFPVAAALLILTLLPAVRRGPGYVARNGTPWGWPWFPWTAFVVLIAAVAFRTFALSMTFGPVGPIWVNLSSGARAISFDTMWGTYFLIPPLLAVLVLVLEAGLVTGNTALVRRVVKAAPLLVLLSVPMSHGSVFRGFLHDFTNTLGSPIWLAVGIQVAFYGWAWMRRAAGAGAGLLVTLLMFSVVGPRTLGLSTLTATQAWPIIAVAGVLLVRAVLSKSSPLCTLSAALFTLAAWLALPETDWSGYRMSVSYHLLWGAVVAIGLVFRDRFSETLRRVGALQIPIASLVVFTGSRAAEIPWEARVLYFAVLTVASLTIARAWRLRWYMYAFTAQVAMACYGIVAIGFRSAAASLGQATVISFSWSVAALLIAFLISAHKARWLPERYLPAWLNGHPSDPTLGPPNPDEPPPPGGGSGVG